MMCPQMEFFSNLFGRNQAVKSNYPKEKKNISSYDNNPNKYKHTDGHVPYKNLNGAWTDLEAGT